MLMKSKKKNRPFVPKAGSALQKNNCVVDAVVFSTPDLSLYIKLQNLLNYFLECLNEVAASPQKENAHQLYICIDHIVLLATDRSESFDSEIRRMLAEFQEETRKFEKLLKAFSSPTSDMLIPARASYLHWLAVCILEELKKPFSRNQSG